jgi:hypothetical protein
VGIGSKIIDYENYNISPKKSESGEGPHIGYIDCLETSE